MLFTNHWKRNCNHLAQEQLATISSWCNNSIWLQFILHSIWKKKKEKKNACRMLWMCHAPLAAPGRSHVLRQLNCNILLNLRRRRQQIKRATCSARTRHMHLLRIFSIYLAVFSSVSAAKFCIGDLDFNFKCRPVRGAFWLHFCHQGPLIEIKPPPPPSKILPLINYRCLVGVFGCGWWICVLITLCRRVNGGKW